MKRLLFIAHRVPYPPDKGERVRAFHEIQALAQHFRVTVAALAHAPSEAIAGEGLKQWCEKVIVAPAGGRLALLRGALGLLRGRSITEGFFSSRRMPRLLAQEAGREPFDLVLGYSSGALNFALDVPAGARVMDLVDADSAKWADYSRRAAWPGRWLYRKEARGVRALEKRAVEQCDAVVVVSEAEARALGAAGEKIVAVGNGVDLDYFRPIEPDRAAWPSVVFTGTMDYRPNVEGVCWFVREIWPALRRLVPGLTFTIAGRNPTRAVRRLAGAPDIVVTGAVPDVRPYLSAATVVVVPLRIARGVQNKILEAMAMGKAVVASAAAIEGLEVTAPQHLLKADRPEEWRDGIVKVVEDESFRSALARAARGFVEAGYAWATRMAPLVSLCQRLTARGTGAGPVQPRRLSAEACRGVPGA